MIQRTHRAVQVLLAAAFFLASNIAATQTAVEFTFLKAHTGKRDALKRFIVANWLAMDDVAIQYGLMSGYPLLERPDDSGAWDIAVVVTYPQPRGYAGIAPEFEKIRAAHRMVLIDGADLRELSRIVESHRLVEATGPVPR
jgi:hypothetical protein